MCSTWGHSPSLLPQLLSAVSPLPARHPKDGDIEGKLIRFRCHTGHAYTISDLLSEVTESVQTLLYQSTRGLEESKLLLESLGDYFAQAQQQDTADLFLAKAAQTGRQARVVHDSIFEHERLSGDLKFEKDTSR